MSLGIRRVAAPAVTRVPAGTQRRTYHVASPPRSSDDLRTCVVVRFGSKASGASMSTSNVVVRVSRIRGDLDG
jgi:hypothetical protein